MSEVKETRLFLCFIIFALTVCTIGLTMTSNPPMSDIYGAERYTTDVYKVCDKLVGHESLNYPTCLSERGEPNMAILGPRVLFTLAISSIATVSVFLSTKAKKTEALA